MSIHFLEHLSLELIPVVDRSHNSDSRWTKSTADHLEHMSAGNCNPWPDIITVNRLDQCQPAFHEPWIYLLIRAVIERLQAVI